MWFWDELEWRVGQAGMKRVVRFAVDPEGRSLAFVSVFSFGRNAISCTFTYSAALETIRSLLNAVHSTLFAVFLCWSSI